MWPEVAAAHVLSYAISRRVGLRQAAEWFFSKNPRMSYLKPPVRVLTLGAARHYRLIEYVITDELGYRLPPDGFHRALVLVVGFSLLIQKRRQGLTRMRRLLERASIPASVAEELLNMNPKELIWKLKRAGMLDVAYSVPRWMLEEAEKAKIPELERFLARLQQDPTQWLRVSTHLISRDELLQKLDESGIAAVKDVDLPDVIKILEYVSPSRIPGMDEGLCVLEDKASVFVGHAVGEVKGKTAVDLTGGAGLKATHLAQRGAERVLVCELSPSRARRARGLARKLKLKDRVDVCVCDSRRPPFNLEKFDVIIVDPSCSGLGRLCAEPERKLWLRPLDIERHARHQAQLLEVAIRGARRGAIIVYSVCSWAVAEAEGVVRRVVENVNVRVEFVKPEIKVGTPSAILPETIRLYPHLHETTGFFVAILERG